MKKPMNGAAFRRILPFALLFAAAFAAEVLVCNFSFVKSLFYRPVDLTDKLQILREQDETGSVYTLAADGIDLTIHNVHFDVELPQDAVIPYRISLTDEGDYYAYQVPERQIVPGLDITRYTNLYPYGRVDGLSAEFRLPADAPFLVNKVEINAHRPLHIRWVRLAVLFGALLSVYLLRPSGRLPYVECRDKSGRQRALTVGVVLLLIGLAWQLARVNPICVRAPWPHQKQYQELAQALAEGSVALEKEPSEELKRVKNPYDTIYLQANGIDYQADYAYYQGRYYVYFGIVPELLLYLPCYLVTGRSLPNYLAVFLLYSGFVVMIFALLREMLRRFFPRTPFLVYLMLGTVFACSGNYIYIISRPDMYDVPVIAANLFTAAGLWFWLKYLSAADSLSAGYTSSAAGRWKRRSCLFLGSLCMALVSGCRPQMLLFSALAIPLFWKRTVDKRELFSRRSWQDTLLLCLPYVVTAAGVMAYNALRFGNPFDFGATYSLTSNDMTKRGFNLSRMFLGMYYFFLQPPLLGSRFPFLQGNPIETGYMGRMVSEFIYGGLLSCNAITWTLLFAGRVRQNLRTKGMCAFTLFNICAAVIIGAVDVTGAGILQRYMQDMAFGLLLASAIVVAAIAERVRGTDSFRRMMRGLLLLCFLQGAYAFMVVFGNGDTGVNVRLSNPALYYAVESLFRF